MKLKKILAVLSATAMAASMAVVASAGTFEVPAENKEILVESLKSETNLPSFIFIPNIYSIPIL